MTGNALHTVKANNVLLNTDLYSRETLVH